MGAHPLATPPQPQAGVLTQRAGKMTNPRQILLSKSLPVNPGDLVCQSHAVWHP